MGLLDKLYKKAVDLQKKVDSASAHHPASVWWVQKRKQMLKETEESEEE